MKKPHYSPADIARQAEMLGNRVRKSYRRLAGAFERRKIGAFRLYDWDIPEIRAVVDWYEGHLVIGEYTRTQTADLEEWLPSMARAAGAAVGVPEDRLHLRRRRTRPLAGERYQRLARTESRIKVREGDLRFWVNLDDFLDTGLFAHHRETRALVRAESQDADFLNLFGYTGTFTAYAAKGGARSTMTVDASARYLEWAKENLMLSDIRSTGHAFVVGEVRNELRKLARSRRRFTLAVVDPPSFSDRGAGGTSFDVELDHRALLEETLAVVAPGGVIWFATNHQRFVPELEGLLIADLREETKRTVPIDFRNRTIHRVWRLVKAKSPPRR